jgi:hypothetical protein
MSELVSPDDAEAKLDDLDFAVREIGVRQRENRPVSVDDA